MKFVKNSPKFQEDLLFRATFTYPQNLQESAVIESYKKFKFPSEEYLPKFKEQLFLMTAFKVYHISREHGERSSKFVGVKRASVNVWGSMD